MITLSEREWTRVRKQLQEEYAWKPSVFMIRETMKRELGFTTRYHQDWITDTNGRHTHREMICLDFYNDAAESWFRLKYLNRE